MKILIVASDFPYPPDHGGRVDIWELIKTLNRMGLEIDLIATTNIPVKKEAINIVKKHITKLILCERKISWTNTLYSLPFQCKSRSALANISLNSEYDFLLLVTEYVYPILDNPSLKARKIILRIQNDEPEYFRELSRSTSSIVMKIYYWTESMKLMRLDKILFPKVDVALFISFDEWKLKQSFFSNGITYFLPPSLEMNSFEKVQRVKSNKVLFVGSLFMPNNRFAITWYIKNIHRLIKTKNYQFVIAGNSRGLGIKWLQELTNEFSNVIIHDTPSDQELIFIYKTSSVFVNPMQHGAGVNIKTIQAIQKGLPIVSTPIGAQGTGLKNSKHLLISSLPKDFSEQVQKLLNSNNLRNKLVENAQHFLKEEYSSNRIMQIITTLNP